MLDPKTLPWEYQRTVAVKTLYEGLFTLFDESSVGNMTNFFDLNSAEGMWLDKVGAVYNIYRPTNARNNGAVLDISFLDLDILDGIETAVIDEVFRRWIQVNLISSYKFYSMEQIKNDLEYIFQDTVVTFIDGVMSMEIVLTTSNQLMARYIASILLANRHFIGKLPGINTTITLNFIP